METNPTANKIINAKIADAQFIGDHALQYKGCHSTLIQKILLMLVRGVGIRDISEIEKVSIKEASHKTSFQENLLFFKETL